MTRKEIINNFSKVYSVGYCDLQFLLRFKNRIGYNSGTCGWNYDIYAFNNNTIAICTGYRGMPGKTVDYKTVEKYNKKAQNILSNRMLPTETQEKNINKLINKFLEELTNE